MCGCVCMCWFCNVWVCLCMVFVMCDFVMFGCVCMCGFCNLVLFVCVCILMCRFVCLCVCGWCFGNMCTNIYCVLYSFYCVFVLFPLCLCILVCVIRDSVRTTATVCHLKCSSNSSSNNNNNNNIFIRMTKWNSIFWSSNLTLLFTLVSSNTNVTLKMAELNAEACR